MKKTLFFIGLAVWSTSWVQAQTSSADNAVCLAPVLADDPEMAAIDQMLVSSYLNHFCFTNDKDVLNAFGYSPEQVPSFDTRMVAERMNVLDVETPFDLVYNQTVQGFIDLYAVRRRDLTEKVLGVSQLYFPYFEECLAKYNIPLEMKYLAVVESALNPSAISSAGAGGLWQFMVSTGKMYGLQVTSYQDERFDMYKSTDAACRYLSGMYNIYHDWQLVLAAYNSGPGNVNKAIRRAGGKKDFWSIKPFLPKETQGYVPAFIAVNYVMNYASEYNLYPSKSVRSFFETDSVAVHDRLEFSALSKVVDMPSDDIAFLNATYKLREIPGNGARHYLVLPYDKVGLFLANEEMIYAQSRVAVAEPEPVVVAASYNGATKTTWVTEWTNYKVKSGDSLGKIADKYNVSLADVKKWNKIKGSVIHPGQKLRIQHKVKKVTAVEPQEVDTASKEVKPETKENSPETSETTGEAVEVVPVAQTQEAPTETAENAEPAFKYYTVQRGDTLWSIAEKHQGVTVNSIRVLNSNLRDNKLVVGQRIKIREIGG